MITTESHALGRHAGKWSLWALAVSAAISGEFSGWNRGLIEGGFGGLLVALVLVTVMYGCLCLCIAELGTVMPFSGGAFSFARSAFGPWPSFYAGIAQAIQYVLTVASIVVTMGVQVNLALVSGGHAPLPEPVTWAITSAIFVFLNIYGSRLFFRSAIVLAVASLAVLVTFWGIALPHVNLASLLDVPAAATGTAWLPNGLVGIAWAIPFAIWFFLAVEQTVLAGEEACAPRRDLPASLFWALGTLVVAAVCTLVLNAGVAPGARAIGNAADPVLLAAQTHLPTFRFPDLLVLVTLIGSFSSFHSILFAAGRSIYSLSRAGYLPAFMSKTWRARQTPVMAIVTAAVVSVLVALAVKFAPRDVPVASILLNMAVFGAIISYVFQLVSYLVLYVRHPDVPRPFKSPLGPMGAIAGIIIASTAGLLLFANHQYRLGLVGCAGAYLVCSTGFALFGHPRATAAPDEAFGETMHARAQQGGS